MSDTPTQSMTDDTQDDDSHSRRKLLAGIAGIGVLGAGFSAGQATAQSAPDGEIGTASNPYLRAYIDRQVYVGRTSDPSSPDDGTTWYREDL